MLCCLAGIFGRPLAFLSIFWPANAILLGMLLRFPHLNNMGGWFGAFSGFMLADLLTGNYFILTLFLTIANLINPFVTLIFIRLFKLNYKEYNKGLTFLFLFLISSFGGCLISSIFAVLTIPHIPNTFMEMDRIWIDFDMWWTGEILNFVAFLPIILAIPRKRDIQGYLVEKKNQSLNLQNSFPLLAVIMSVTLTHFLSVQAQLCSQSAL